MWTTLSNTLFLLENVRISCSAKILTFFQQKNNSVFVIFTFKIFKKRKHFKQPVPGCADVEADMCPRSLCMHKADFLMTRLIFVKI